MLIRPFNDIHLDFDLDKKQDLSKLWEPIALENDHETTLIISGDLWHSMKFLQFKNFSWMAHIAKRFKYVVFVLGNHDLWGGNITFDYAKVKDEIKNQNLQNVFLLQNDILMLDGIKFLGSTLWTNFNKGNPLVLLGMRDEKDYKFIRSGNDYRHLSPNLVYDIHIKSKNFIFDNAKRENGEKIIVVSHHAPSFCSIADEFRTKSNYYENFAYFSDLDYEIMDSSIDFWFHGHTHNPLDYMIGNTRVINNPRGYNGLQNTGYSEEMVIEI